MKITTLLLGISFLLSPALAFAGPHGKMGPMAEPTKEERTQMVEMHTKMADCLKTDKLMADCHKEMMDSCPLAKNGKCPMMAMGPMGAHHGKMPHDMKKPAGKDKETGK